LDAKTQKLEKIKSSYFQFCALLIKNSPLPYTKITAQ